MHAESSEESQARDPEFRAYIHRVTLRFRVAMLMRERRRPRPSLDELRLTD